MLINDAYIWQLGGPAAESDAGAAKVKWASATAGKKRTLLTKPEHPFGPKRARGFFAAVAHFESWLTERETGFESKPTVLEAARPLAFRGFENWRQVHGLSPCDLVGWSSRPATMALLRRMLTWVDDVVLENNENQQGLRCCKASSSSSLVCNSSSTISVLDV